MKLRLLVPFVFLLSKLAFAHGVKVNGLKEIIVQNNLNVTLEKSKAHRHSKVPQAVTAERIGDRLILKSSSSELQNVKLYASDNFRNLRQLIVQDSSSVKASYIQTHMLKVISESSGSLMLDHVKGVSEITNHGEGKIEAYWLGLPSIDVVASNGKTLLGGNTDNVLVKGYGDAQVNLSGLVTNNAWVLASDDAFIKIRANDFISMVGHGNAIVESYKDVNFLNEVSYDQSALIHIRS